MEGKAIKNVNRNASFLICFNQPRDIGIIASINKQINPGKPMFLQSAYEDAMKTPYGHLFIDLSPNLKDYRLKYRSDILNPLMNICYLPKT